MANLPNNSNELNKILELLENKTGGKSQYINYTNSMVSAVGSYTFSTLQELGTVTFPECVSIDSYAFNNCQNLTSATFAVCDISEYAFNNCANLKEFTMLNASYGVSVGCIGEYAFNGCLNLQRINLYPNTKVELINPNAFSSLIPEVWVSGKAYQDYIKDTTWGRLTNNMQILPGTIAEEETIEE